MKLSILALLTLVLVSTLFWGCQTTGTPKSSQNAEIRDRNEIEQRVAEYITGRKTHDKKRIYAICSPAYKEKVSYSDFSELPIEPTIGMLVAYIQGIEMQSSKNATVWLSEYSKPVSIPTFLLNTGQKTEWVKVDDTWYLDRSLPKPITLMPTCGGTASPQTPQNDSGQDDSVCGD